MPEEPKAGGAGQVAPRRAAFQKRLISTLTLWGLVVAALVFESPGLYYAMMIGFGILGLAEFFYILKLKHARWEAAVTYCVSAAYLTACFWQASDSGGGPAGVDFGFFDALAFAALIFGGFSVLLFFPIRVGRSHVGIVSCVFAFVYVPFLFNFITRILYLPEDAGTGARGYVLFLLVVTKFTDMGAYLVGSLIGRHKMIPHISPGKTWEGMIGAFGFAFLGSFGICWLMPDEVPLLNSSPWITALAAILLALGAVIGDLAESTLKRSLATKDSGEGLPGIGGILDLIDSILFTAPILYFLLVWLSA